MKKLLGPLSASAGALLLSASGFLSYLIGFFRDILLANIFGASTETDAFYSAFLLPDFLFSFLILGFVSGSLLPVFSHAEKKSKRRAENIFHSFLTLVLLFSTIFSAIAFFAAPSILHALFPEKNIHETVYLTRILLLSPIFFGISNTLGTVLLAKKRFFSMAISPALYNIGIIGGILLFGERYGIQAGAWGAVCGALLHLLSRLLDFPRTGIALQVSLRFLPELREIFWLGLPKTIGLIAFQASIIVFTVLAAHTETGGVAAWNFARNIQSLPVSLFGIAFATAALPFFADAKSQKQPKQFAVQLEKSILQILLFTLCSAVGMSIMGKGIVSVLFQHGAFTAFAGAITTAILVPLAFATPFEGLMHLFSRAFLAHKKTVFPAMGRVLFFLLSSASALLFLPLLGIGALGLAFAIAAAGECIFLFIAFHFRCAPVTISPRNIFSVLLLTAVVAAGITTISFSPLPVNDVVRLGIALVVSAGIFFTGLSLLHITAVKELFFRK